MSNSDSKEKVKFCTCDNPTGFRFIEYSSDITQVWEHLTCGGIVERPLFKTEKASGDSLRKV